MIPPIASIVPLLSSCSRSASTTPTSVQVLLNTRPSSSPSQSWSWRSFIDEIPREIDEAATVDGCSPFGILWRAILPLSVPGLICIGLFVFIFTWNEFTGSPTHLVGGKLRPLPPVVGLALTHHGILWGPALESSERWC